jgi:8-oxo-dGTP pyrophosphatase MutT (NUDIX family)
MIINIYYDENILKLLDSQPIQDVEDELHVEFSGRKKLEADLAAFEKNRKKNILVYWSLKEFDKMLKAFVKRFTIVEAAGGVVFNEHREVLFIHRNGKWDLPKGKINGKDRKKAGGESEVTDMLSFFSENCDSTQARIAAMREVREETGLIGLSISGSLPNTYHTYSQGNQKFLKRTFWFRMDGSSTDTLVPQISEGIIIAR